MLAPYMIALWWTAALLAGADAPASAPSAQQKWFRGPLVATSQRAASCTAKSARHDPDAPVGFATSTNEPRLLPTGSPYAHQGVQLVALPDSADRFHSPGDPVEAQYDGFTLLLVNASDDELKLDARDSTLPIQREALDEYQQWRPIEYLDRGFCGNSSHRVFLSPGQYWRFSVPVYAGDMRRPMRFRLSLPGGRAVLSNEFIGTMEYGQFSGGDSLWPAQDQSLPARILGAPPAPRR